MLTVNIFLIQILYLILYKFIINTVRFLGIGKFSAKTWLALIIILGLSRDPIVVKNMKNSTLSILFGKDLVRVKLTYILILTLDQDKLDEICV